MPTPPDSSPYRYETAFLEAAAPELKSYLLSDEVYWELGLPAPGGDRPPYPQFSLGWLLLFRRRVEHLAAGSAIQAVLADISATRTAWMSAWRRKAALEFGQRLKLWADFMHELRQNPVKQRDRYAYEVQRRTMLSLLAAEADTLPEAQAGLLRATDAALRQILQPGPFVDRSQFQPGFPADEFWFLYGTPGSNRSP